MILDKEELTEKINSSLDQLRPFLHADGGDMQQLFYESDDTESWIGRSS